MLAFLPFPAPAAVPAVLLNKLLEREDWARTRLSRHAGKTVRFDIGGARLSLCIDAQGYVQTSDSGIVPDVTLSMPLEHLSRLPTLVRSKDAAQLTALLHIQGDAGLAQTVAELARDLRWDLEHELSEKLGDIAARRLVSGSAALLNAVRQSGRHLAENAGEYLAHESNFLANRQVFRSWQDQLQELQLRLDRLDTRLEAVHTATTAAPEARMRKRPHQTPAGSARLASRGGDHA